MDEPGEPRFPRRGGAVYVCVRVDGGCELLLAPSCVCFLAASRFPPARRPVPPQRGGRQAAGRRIGRTHLSRAAPPPLVGGPLASSPAEKGREGGSLEVGSRRKRGRTTEARRRRRRRRDAAGLGRWRAPRAPCHSLTSFQETGQPPFPLPTRNRDGGPFRQRSSSLAAWARPPFNLPGLLSFSRRRSRFHRASPLVPKRRRRLSLLVRAGRR